MTLLQHIGMEEKVRVVLKSMYENRVKLTLGDINTGWMEWQKKDV